MTEPSGTPRPQPTPLDIRYRDVSLPVADRVSCLLGQMTLEEKAGLFFQTAISIGEGGELAGPNPQFGTPSTREYVKELRMSHFNVAGAAPDARTMALWSNRLQELASTTRLGIPVTLSTDPRHSFSDNPGAAIFAGPFSQWPETLGLAAIGDEELVERFADIARQEYLAVGIRLALHPQVDLATEPRWARQVQTFGADAGLTARLAAAYIRGFQGNTLGPGSVATMAKHFPGGGPQKDGEDPHFSYGRDQVYPGGQFELHLRPFEAALEAGCSQIMPYYGVPIGTQYEEVGFGFNKSVVTGLLRERYHFDGVVCTDWGLLSDHQILGEPFPARAWGVEDLSVRDRMVRALNAGVDQFGGEALPGLLADIVRSGEISEQRLDVSARRLLREKFVLGLFDNAAVEVGRAVSIVGNVEFRSAGEAAQSASITVLENRGVLPLTRGSKLYVEGVPDEVARQYGTVVTDSGGADVAVLRLQAAYEQRPSMFENFFHAGSLDFPAELIEHILRLAAAVPTVVDVFLDRPAILTPFAGKLAGLVVNYGASPDALMKVLFGAEKPLGRLPFDLPSSMAAVRSSRPDVPFDTQDPLYRFGHGLSI